LTINYIEIIMLCRLTIRFIFSILNFILVFQTYFKRNYTKFFPCVNCNNTILLISLSLIIISTSLYNSNLSYAQNIEDNADEDNADEDNADEDNADEDNADEDNADEDNADEDNADEDNADEEEGDNFASELFSSSNDDTTTSDNGQSNVPLLSNSLEGEPTANIQPSSPNPSIPEELSPNLNAIDPNALNKQPSPLDNGLFVHRDNNQPTGDAIVNPNLKELNIGGIGPLGESSVGPQVPKVKEPLEELKVPKVKEPLEELKVPKVKEPLEELKVPKVKEPLEELKGGPNAVNSPGDPERIKPEKHFDIMTTVDLNITDTEKIKTDVGGQPIPFQYIIIFDDKFTANPNSLATTFQALSLLVESLGGEVIFTYNNTISGIAFKTVDQQKSDQILEILSLDPRVKFAEQDKIVVPFSQVIPSGIQRIGIENVAMTSDIEHISIDADIAVIDSGIDLDHPDLNVFKNITSIIPQILSSKDNTLRATDINLNKIGLNVENNLTTFYPPFSQDSSSTGDDNCGHGTHVAGIAAAKDNAIGVIGIAPGAKLWAIKVLDYDKNSGKCFGSISSVIAAIDYVTKNADQIDVANLSLGCKCNSTALDEAISKSIVENVVYVTAAGNIHTDASFFSPANHKEVLTVSAIADADGKCGSLGTPLWVDAGDFSGFSNDDTFASFSNYGSVVDIAAPGVKINSTYINGTYALMGGTSIASPHVTGLVALYKSINPTVSPKEMSEKLTNEGLYPNAVCDGYSYGYFDQDSDNSPEPLLHSFDMVNIKVNDSNVKVDPDFWNTFSDIAKLR
jgi:subtilisin family serine protease